MYLLGLPRIRAFECSYPTILTALSSILMHPRHLCRAIEHSCRATRIPVAQSNAYARYLAPSSCYRASLSHTRCPCA